MFFVEILYIWEIKDIVCGAPFLSSRSKRSLLYFVAWIVPMKNLK